MIFSVPQALIVLKSPKCEILSGHIDKFVPNNLITLLLEYLSHSLFKLLVS